MVLASMVVSGKPRFLLLRTSGEVWPISSNDVQFIMPSSLIRPSLARECWSPELVDLWAQGDESTGAEVSEAMAPMLKARRKAVMVLRKISRETERMCGKLVGDIGRSKFGGIEGLWDKLASDQENERVGISSAEAAEIMLNAAQEELPEEERTEIKVKPSTLPAYAAHNLLMGRADLFLADQGDMAASGRFLVRSRAERAQMQAVSRLVQARSVEDRAVFSRFVDKVKKVVQYSMNLKQEAPHHVREYKPADMEIEPWTEEEKAIISTLLLRLFETRSTQVQSAEAYATHIMKALKVYPEEMTLDRTMIASFFADMGVLPPWENLKRSEVREAESRALAVSGLRPSSDIDMLHGNELDELRHDFTSQKVFVIDDATASELDDGISVERIPGSDSVWIHVHIADPTRFISLNSSIATRASFRGSSVYLPEGNVPLFPLEVIMKELSLGAKVERDDGAQGTMTFSTKLSPNGKVMDSAVRMGWIKKPRVVTYSSVNDVLGVPNGTLTRPLGTPMAFQAPQSGAISFSAEDVEDLRLIQKFASACRSQRLRQAGLEYSNPTDISFKIITDIPAGPDNYFDLAQLPAKPSFFPGLPIINYTVPVPATTYRGLPSTSIVSEMMILAGRNAAQFCLDRKLPAPYRSSKAPTPIALPGHKAVTLDELLAMRDPESGLIDAYTLNAANIYSAPGDISMTPAEHWSMGFTDKIGYLRATSPLRRFDDMLVHWQIKSALAKERGLSNAHVLASEIPEEDMRELALRSEPAQRKARKVGNTALEWWQAGLFASRLREPRPDAYTFGEDAVDLSAPMPAKVAGHTVYGTTSNANTTPIVIPALGLKARLPGRGKSNLVIGQDVTVRLIGAQQWPAAIIDVQLVD